MNEFQEPPPPASALSPIPLRQKKKEIGLGSPSLVREVGKFENRVFPSGTSSSTGSLKGRDPPLGGCCFSKPWPLTDTSDSLGF